MAQLEHAKGQHETVMDVTAEQIARVYAKAFLEVAAKSPKFDQLVEEVDSLVADVLDRTPRLEELLNSALVSGEEKEQMLGRVFGKRASTARNSGSVATIATG